MPKKVLSAIGSISKDEVKKLIESSELLTPDQKEAWLADLDHMSDVHLRKLADILGRSGQKVEELKKNFLAKKEALYAKSFEQVKHLRRQTRVRVIHEKERVDMKQEENAQKKLLQKIASLPE